MQYSSAPQLFFCNAPLWVEKMCRAPNSLEITSLSVQIIYVCLFPGVMRTTSSITSPRRAPLFEKRSLANTFSSLNQTSVYADLPSFMSPSLIAGDYLRPDLLLLTGNYVLELTLGFEINVQANRVRKANKYTPLL